MKVELYVVSMSLVRWCLVQSREQRKIEAIEKTFEKIEQRQKSGRQRDAAAGVNNAEPNRVTAHTRLSHGSHAYWKVLDFLSQISISGKSCKMSLVLKNPGN